MRKFCFYITLFLSAALFSQSYLSSSLPSPKDSGAENYVCNPDGILSDTCCIALNRLSETLDRRVEVELAVCAINAISGDDAYSFALNLFNTWGIGKSGKNTGVLILLVMHSRDIQIITGGGIEGLLPDAQCKRIIENDMVPLLSAGKYDEGMLRGAEAIAQRLLTDEAQAELLLDVKRKDTTGTDILTLYLGAALLMLILLSLYTYSLLNNNTDAANNIRYRQARTGRAFFIIFSVIFPFPILFLALYYRRALRRLRTAPVTCPCCHSTMRLLSEEEEDRWLSPIQQSEERVHSTDYDVWLCPTCMNHLIYPYDSSESGSFKHCPKCGGRTLINVSDVVKNPPSSFADGSGIRTSVCKHCGHHEYKTYIIPKLPDVAIGGGGGKGGATFNGGFGGSFGGGVSFGGGAGGKF